MSISDETVETAHIPNAELHARGIRFCPGCQATRLRKQSVGVVMSPEVIEAAEEAVRQAMIEHGPDGHTDGSEEITRAALEAAAPHMRAATFAEGWLAGNAYREQCAEHGEGEA